MQPGLYCEPCSRLLRGDVSIVEQGDTFVVFDHHYTLASLEQAMRLPCMICSLAYSNVDLSQYALHWAKTVGKYLYYIQGDGRFLEFWQHVGCSLPGKTLVLRPCDDLHDCTITYELSPSTRSESTFKFLLAKYHSCRSQHVQCASPRQGSVARPSRLLDVGKGNDPAVLRNTKDIGHAEEYTCVSHCWGQVKPYTLNANTHSALATGIDIQVLPRTFQDAIYVTRRLGIRYIWIDSLCILQDDKNDWATESGHMGDIYAHAACTIAASDSNDCGGGLFFDREPLSMLPRRIKFDFRGDIWREGFVEGFAPRGEYLCDTAAMALDCLESAPLNTRAWVSQERQLSHRILHFTAAQCFWECHECSACETYPEYLPEWARQYYNFNPTMLKTRLYQLARQNGENKFPSSALLTPVNSMDYVTYRIWRAFRFQYSTKALTYEADKLVAIRGVAARISQLTGDQFVAGLWRSRIIQDLCWYAQGYEGKAKNWTAPSWSWASSKSDIMFSQVTQYHFGHPTLQDQARLLEVDVKTKASGEVEHASITIQCKPLRAIFTPVVADDPADHSLLGLLQLMNRYEDALECRLPYLAVMPEVQFRIDEGQDSMKEPQDGYVVVMQQCKHDEPSKIPHGSVVAEEGTTRREGKDKTETERQIEDETLRSVGSRLQCVDALFVRKVDGDDNRYERVGLIHCIRDIEWILSAHEKAEERVITLV